jgi:hypothetical protein
MTSPPDIRGQEVIGERRGQVRVHEPAERHVHMLRAEQDFPAQRADEQDHEVQHECGDEPGDGRIAHVLPGLAGIDAREQDVEQADADADFEGPQKYLPLVLRERVRRRSRGVATGR